MNNPETAIIIFLGGILLILLIFLAFRELNTWYWKINERITLQKETNSLLREILANTELKNIDQFKPGRTEPPPFTPPAP